MTNRELSERSRRYRFPKPATFDHIREWSAQVWITAGAALLDKAALMLEAMTASSRNRKPARIGRAH